MSTMPFTLVHIGHTSLSFASIAAACALLVLALVVAIVLDRKAPEEMAFAPPSTQIPGTEKS